MGALAEGATKETDVSRTAHLAETYQDLKVIVASLKTLEPLEPALEACMRSLGDHVDEMQAAQCIEKLDLVCQTITTAGCPLQAGPLTEFEKVWMTLPESIFSQLPAQVWALLEAADAQMVQSMNKIMQTPLDLLDVGLAEAGMECAKLRKKVLKVSSTASRRKCFAVSVNRGQLSVTLLELSSAPSKQRRFCILQSQPRL